MANLDPTSSTAKWVARMQAAGTQIKEGVNAVTTAPGVAAAAKKATWLARVTASADKWATNVRAVTLTEWRTKMLTVGIQRISSGVTAKQANYQKFAEKFYPYLAAGKAQIDAMPTGTVQQGIAKATAQILYNNKFSYTRTG